MLIIYVPECISGHPWSSGGAKDVNDSEVQTSRPTFSKWLIKWLDLIHPLWSRFGQILESKVEYLTTQIETWPRVLRVKIYFRSEQFNYKVGFRITASEAFNSRPKCTKWSIFQLRLKFCNVLWACGVHGVRLHLSQNNVWLDLEWMIAGLHSDFIAFIQIILYIR